MNQKNETPESDLPIAALADLEQEVSPQFLGSLRRKIYRRTTANQMVSFSWNLPKLIFIEMLMLIGHVLQGSGREKL